LEEWLQDFPGCVVIVSHDRFLLDKLCDHLFILEGDGKIKDFNGKYLDYRDIQAEREREQRRLEKEVSEKLKAPQVRTASGLTSSEKNEIKKLEREIAALEEQKRQIHVRFSGSEIAVEEIQKLSIELKSVEETLEAKEMRWLELSDK
jgi:ATP-binding cassette subfamily F protein uup